MCSRYSRKSLLETLMDRFQIGREDRITPQYNIAPTDESWVIVEDENGRKLVPMLFGLIPNWAKDTKIALSCINARADTILEKPSFRNAIRNRRCIIPADGFFEWKRDGKVKIPFYFHAKDNNLLGIAGIWDEWQSPLGKKINTFSIITTDPNETMKPIHDRMPVILSPLDEPKWFSKSTPIEIITSLLRPAPDGALDFYQVSPYVSNSRNKGIECIAKV